MPGEGVSIESVGAVLAVLVAAYAVLLQSKKSQTAVGTVYNLILISCVLIFVVTLGHAFDLVLTAWSREPFGIDKSIDTQAARGIAGALLLAVFAWAILWMILGDIAINRYFRTDRGVIRRRLRAKLLRERNLDPKPMDRDKIAQIFKSFFYLQNSDACHFLDRAIELDRSLSVLVTKSPSRLHNDEVAALALDTLTRYEDCFVEYVSCTRHPVELFDDIVRAHMRRTQIAGRDAAIEDLKQQGVLSRLLLIDAHTPHFGFDERVYAARTASAEKLGAEIDRSVKSYPGVHTTLAKGYDRMAARLPAEDASGGKRLGIVILDEPSALADVDSISQFKLFIRHVVASERLMGGILTVVYETRSALAEAAFLPEVVDWHFDFHHRFDVAFPPWQIEEGVARCARAVVDQIRQQNPPQPIILMPVLDGGRMFATALRNEMEREWARLPAGPAPSPLLQLQAIRASKYGKGSTGDRGVEISGLRGVGDLAGRIVLLVDDICHSGDTIKTIRAKLEALGATVWTAVAIQRSDERIDFWALDFHSTYRDLPDAWMYGFGMDDAGKPESRDYSCFIFKRRYADDMRLQ